MPDSEDITFEGTTYAAPSDYASRLSAINATLQFTNIKGKDYAQVNQRILAFWSLFPNGRIVTKKLFDDEKRCDFEAMVYRDQADEKPAATGHAFEVKSGHINSTSYVENCETSAIGRALGFMGIGATTAIASAEEVMGAAALQDAQQIAGEPKMPPAQGEFTARCQSCGRAYVFHDVNSYMTFLNNPGCCPNPAWEVE